ncbi:hypothetical protein QWY85_07415 [Neolewinella lacunae]|uniref:Uncharacterized protein n=1 Tax=Neolewinella lacunae TaxID=1517758 RepID=A0A923PMW3_9BACT|nr:hypothetical protein [Neolewinella lacunae]MBC6994606.1 hypothetical protein [Neolewinella lacunae]MDN3634478.1 hypothetical protein [Neolewinella lacunae]
MEEQVLHAFTSASAFSSGFTFIYALLTVRAHWRELWPLSALVLVSVLTEYLANPQVHRELFGTSTNLPALHVYTALQTILLLLVFRGHLSAMINPWAPVVLMVLFGVFAAVNAAYIDGLYNFNPHARALQSIILLLVAISYLFRLLRDRALRRLTEESLFWVSAALILYFSGNFLIFMASEPLLNAPGLLIGLYSIHSILNILANLLYTLAFCAAFRRYWFRSLENGGKLAH